MTLFFEEIMQTSIKSVRSVSGGDINDAYRIESSEGLFFAKINESQIASEMLGAEAKALNLLSGLKNIRVPKVILLSNKNDITALILEWIETGTTRPNTLSSLGIMIAELHLNTAQAFGLDYDNYIGSLPQSNTWTDNWLDFYYNNRIQTQLKLAMESGKIPLSFIHRTDRVFANMQKEFPEVKPSLLHGDLWAGNYMIGKEGDPVLIDPSLSYGHRELDIAMMHLFGGFNTEIISVYESVHPLEHDWQSRMKFYQLYYILVHVNLFGGSYVRSAMSIINHYA